MIIEDGTGSSRRAKVDKKNRLYTKSVSIDYGHNEIHSGNSFYCNYHNEVTNTDEMTVIAFNAPKEKEMHLVIRAESTGNAHCYLYENTSIDAGEGTTLAVYNRKRSSSRTSGISTIEAVPVVGSATSFNEAQAAGANITTTTELWNYHLGVAVKKASEGSAGRGVNEWILGGNIQYAIVLQTATDDDATHALSLNWYEE